MTQHPQYIVDVPSFLYSRIREIMYCSFYDARGTIAVTHPSRKLLDSMLVYCRLEILSIIEVCWNSIFSYNMGTSLASTDKVMKRIEAHVVSS